jgi:hypothetical protein
MLRCLAIALLIVVSAPSSARAGESDALAISASIQQRHLPHGTILDPVFAAPDSEEIVGYRHAGDSAIWTGHYLAAEAFRFSATGSPEALDNARRAVAGIRALVDVTGTGLLARCLVPVDSPWADFILGEEARHGIHSSVLDGREYFWLGNTSRDQYAGVFFGLAAAHDLIGDAALQSEIRGVVTRLLDFLVAHDWFVVMPDGSISTTFAGRPEQILAFLAIGRAVDPGRFASEYETKRIVHFLGMDVGILYDLLDEHTSYFKFNLNAITLYNLIRLETSGLFRDRYLQAYRVQWRTTDDHANPHFNMIDHAVQGPADARDAATRDLLAQWLARPRRDVWRDWRGDPRYPACGEDRACAPLAVADRINIDFLWQRSPFLLYGGSDGRVETTGIDYILPYWMARSHGVLHE